jgi:signal transduction histidine kinase
MGEVLEEGRNALKRLRSSTSSGTLDVEEALSRIQHELAATEQVFKVAVEGEPRPVHPIIRDEVYRICREALLNAFRHAGANRIDVEVEYKTRRFRVTVKDDGRGIDPQRSQSQGDGRLGLSGMRERAEGIGGRLKVRSRPGGGTVVELSVPGHIAFPSRRIGGNGKAVQDLTRET